MPLNKDTKPNAFFFTPKGLNRVLNCLKRCENYLLEILVNVEPQGENKEILVCIADKEKEEKNKTIFV